MISVWHSAALNTLFSSGAMKEFSEVPNVFAIRRVPQGDIFKYKPVFPKLRRPYLGI